MTDHGNPDPIPRTVEQWRHCIVVDCRIELTRDYVERRIRELEDPNDHGTRRFIECYGTAHHAQVLGWFRSSLPDLQR